MLNKARNNFDPLFAERKERIKKYFAPIWSKEYTTESNFLKDAKELCRMLAPKCIVVRAEAVTIAGVADLLLCYEGRFIAAELKKQTGIPSPQQLKFIAEIKEAGGKAAVCKNLKELWALVDTYCAEFLK